MQDAPHCLYSPEKKEYLKRTRGISFEEVELAIEQGRVLNVEKHPNEKKYPNQKIYVIHINDYVYLVPFVRKGNAVFLKTIFPSRKAKKQYMKDEVLYER